VIRSRIAAGAMALVLSACAVAPSTLGPLPALQGVPEAFEMSGRIAVRQGERNEIARLRWTHESSRDLWIIASPLGNEVARIESGPEGAVLQQGGERRQAGSFSALTEALLGVALDPAVLAGWLHGREGNLPGEGWTIQLEDRQPAGAVSIVRRISASRADVAVRLVVDSYEARER
jgi:outer membrane lipoprotein LolB